MGRHLVATCDARFLVRVAVREQLTLGGDDRGVTLIPDADPIHHPPEFLEVDSADEPSLILPVTEASGEDGCRQQIVVHGKARHQNAVDLGAVRARDRHGRFAQAAGDCRAPVLVNERQFPEFRKLEDVILEDSVLLPRRQSGLLQVRGDGFENLDAAGHVQIDLLADLPRDVQVALDDGFLSAIAERVRSTPLRRRAAA